MIIGTGGMSSIAAEGSSSSVISTKLKIPDASVDLNVPALVRGKIVVVYPKVEIVLLCSAAVEMFRPYSSALGVLDQKSKVGTVPSQVFCLDLSHPRCLNWRY